MPGQTHQHPPPRAAGGNERNALLDLQRSLGNRGVTRILGAGPTSALSVQRQSQASRGASGGQSPQILTVDGPVSQQCGHALWGVNFQLPSPAASDGWIVQEVTFVHSQHGVLDHFWEAWFVGAGETMVTGPSPDDTYLSSGETGRGFVRIVGVARFMAGPLPPQFPAGSTPTGPQPTTTQRPSGWTGTGTEHRMRVNFNSSPAPGTTQVSAWDGVRMQHATFP